MGFSQAQKAESRKRVVETASRQIREKGIEGLGVAECMRGAGLTQGAFYGHFASRDALIVEALQHALDMSLDRTDLFVAPWPEAESSNNGGRDPVRKRHAQPPARPTSLPSFVDRYLTRQHVDMPGEGCALAALAGESRHAEHEVRALLTEHVKHFSARMAQAAGTDDDVAGLRIVTMLVGALTLARSVDDPVLVEKILAGAREQVLSTEAQQRQPNERPTGPSGETQKHRRRFN